MTRSDLGLELGGCAPDPLMSYLKSLGVMRLVGEQLDRQVRSAWRNDAFVLYTDADHDALLRFFLDDYIPTPLLAPWNKGSGFWDTTANGRAMAAVRTSTSARLQPYRDALQFTDAILQDEGWVNRKAAEQKMKDAGKFRLLRRLRNELPESAVVWLDALAVLTSDKPEFAPVLGTGANDGRFDFTPNFARHLSRIMPFTEHDDGRDKPRRAAAGEYHPKTSREWLEASLFAEGNPVLLSATGGQYHPGGTGGANASASGYEGQSLLNPWDFVLMMEGSLVMAAAVARRLGSEGAEGDARLAAFPFTARPSTAGAGTVSAADSDGARAELWLPIWTRMAAWPEIQALFAEGRAQMGRHQAVSGVEFAIAAASLGTDRGIAAFQRFGVLERNGRAYFATPLGRVRVRERNGARLLEQVQPWISRVRRLSGDHASLSLAVTRADQAVFRFVRGGSASDLLRTLGALGRTERLVSRLPKVREFVRPLSLRSEWWRSSDDGSDEFRLAASVAQMWWPERRVLRSFLEPVEVSSVGRPRWNASAKPIWTRGSLADNLLNLLWYSVAVLQQPSQVDQDPKRPGPTAPRWASAPSEAVNRFLFNDADDSLLEDVIWGLACMEPGSAPHRDHFTEGGDARVTRSLPVSYLIPKLLFLGYALPAPSGGGEAVDLMPDPAVLVNFRAGHAARALEIAIRRLTGRGLVPLGLPQTTASAFAADFASGDSARWGAALVFPIRHAHVWTRYLLANYKKEETA